MCCDDFHPLGADRQAALCIEPHLLSYAFGDNKVPVKKVQSRLQERATPKARGRSNSFRHFVRNLRGVDPVLAAFKVHATENAFPNIDAWAEIRSYLVRTGAQHDAMVGARIAWREFQRR